MIELRVLGSLDLKGEEGEDVLSVLAQPKRMALLAYLATAEAGAFHQRDKLVGLFWPESDQERARGALRKAIHFLRRALGDAVILSRGDESVGLSWDRVRVDAGDFEAALEADDLAGALDLYRGDFLEGFFLEGCQEFQDWVEGERGRLRERASGAGWVLAHELLEGGELNAGEREARRALSLIPTDESEARRFIQALAAAGDRAAAVDFFETFARGIREKLELEPSPRTLAAVERIRSGDVGEAPQAEAAASVSRPATSGSVPPKDALAALTQELAPGLEVLRHLGTGRYGEVYLARQQPLGRLVAVKLLSRSLADNPVARTRFEREAMAAASLDHPHTAAVHHFGFLSDGVPYLVMQYVKGGNLEDRLAAEGPLPIPEARRLLSEVAQALAALHEEGFVHRDVRPANVLLDPESDRAILTDFGLAGILPEKEGVLPRVTAKGEVVGSDDFLSPEQIEGKKPTGGTDIYLLGLLGYEALIGDGPFPGRSDQQKLRAHLHATPRSLTVLREDVPPELASLLERCLAKDPQKRPRAAYLAEAFSREGDDEVRATSVLGWLRASRLGPWKWIGPVALVFAVLGVVWIALKLLSILS